MCLLYSERGCTLRSTRRESYAVCSIITEGSGESFKSDMNINRWYIFMSIFELSQTKERERYLKKLGHFTLKVCFMNKVNRQSIWSSC